VKKVLPFLFALAAMGIAMVVMTQVFHLDIKEEVKRLMPEAMGEEMLPPE
jgi:hypothetical protein